MQLNKWTIIILSVVLCCGCIEPFEPDIAESREVLVIEGSITDALGIQTVTISTSSPYQDPQFQPVSGCVVRVEDESGSGITFLENEEGSYQWDPEPGFIAAGKAYKLTVITPGDEVYESEYDTLLACATIDQLYYKVEMQGTSDPDIHYFGIRFYLDMKGTPEQSRNYMWTFEETWEYLSYHRIQYIWDGSQFLDYTPQLYGFKTCYLTDRLANFQVGSSSMLGTNEIHQQPLHFVTNQTPRLQEQYSLLVRQYSLSDDAFLYWDKINAQSGDAGGLFETQPSRTTGNISNVNHPEERVLGYFFASQVREKRMMVKADFDFPVVGFDCPLDTAYSQEDFGRNYPYLMYSLSIMGRGPPYAYSYKECHDCTYRGGVTTKPEYWDD